MCGRTADIPLQVMMRAIAAGVVGTPQEAAAWALEESERLKAAEIGGLLWRHDPQDDGGPT